VVCIVVCIVDLTVRGEGRLRFGEVHVGGGDVDVRGVSECGVQMFEVSPVGGIE
jgi:hypothetical protein